MVRLQVLATLTDIDGNPLPNKTIEFYVSTDNVNFTLIDTKTTDSNGNAETIYEAEKQSTYYFKAKFPGDDTYDPSEAEASYTVEAAPTKESIVDICFALARMLMMSEIIRICRGEEPRPERAINMYTTCITLKYMLPLLESI